ncbi:MAG: binding-protein-dependent transport system inner rane component [Chloroflexi bacterium]|jgi:ABC-type sugar transport system permease subunit|nr:binding-protein-dependent transport system inner rane component [Chloroflexota bacterium]
MAATRRPSRRLREDRILAAVLLAPALLIIAVVTIYPLLHSFWISLHAWNLMKPKEGNPFVGLDNYINTLTDPIFLDSLRVTIIFTIAAVVIEISLAMGIALILNRKFIGRGLVRMLALLPWAVPAVVNGIMWKWILNPSYGALNGLLYSLGLIDEYVIWLGSPELALAMVVVADLWKETPFIMLLLLAALQTIPKDLYEAATVDGANVVQSFFRITLPLIQPVLFVAIALRTIWALKSFDLIYTLTAGGPSNGTSVVGYYTYIKSFVSLQLGRGAAVAYIMTLFVLILVYIYYRVLYRKVEY